MTRRFSVVLPTRERADTLEWALRTVAAIDYDNLQIVVSDNDSQDRTESVVRQLNDPRILYVNTGQRLSMSHNWEFALSKVDGDWVTFLGDDDGLLPDCIDKVNSIIDWTDTSAIRSTGCSYFWPDSMVFGNTTLIVPVTKGYEKRRSSHWLRKLYAGKAAYTDLPVFYNGGFVELSAIQRSLGPDGRFFRSCIPDVYSSVALGKVLQDYIFLREPLHVSGRSRHSTGAAFSSPDTYATPRETFLSERNIPLHPGIPTTADGGLPGSIQAFVYEAHLQSQHLATELTLPSASQQLKVILRTSGKHRRSVEDWGGRFASAYGLDPAKSRSNRLAHFVSLAKDRLTRNVQKTFFKFTYRDSAGALDNVMQASVVAADILRSKPSVPYSAIQNLFSRRCRPKRELSTTQFATPVSTSSLNTAPKS